MSTVAACQLPYVDGDVETALGNICESARYAVSKGADLVCFPECYLQGYVFDGVDVRPHALDLASPPFEALLSRLAPLNAVLVFGLIEVEAGRLFNTAVVVRKGELLGRYRKVNLLPGESIFDPGETVSCFATGDLPFGINICNDLNFSEGVAAAAAPNARLLVAPCNNMMGKDAAEIWRNKHNQIRSERARESGLWILSADVCGTWKDRVSYGPTALIDPSGQVVAQVPIGEPGVLVYQLDERSGTGA